MRLQLANYYDYLSARVFVCVCASTLCVLCTERGVFVSFQSEDEKSIKLSMAIATTKHMHSIEAKITHTHTNIALFYILQFSVSFVRSFVSFSLAFII